MIIHMSLANGRWFEFSTAEQMANIGCDIDRAIRWKKNGNEEQSQGAFDRALELFDFTIQDPKNRGGKLKEIVRLREAFIGFFTGDNIYKTTEKMWNNYFMNFNYLAAIQRGK